MSTAYPACGDYYLFSNLKCMEFLIYYAWLSKVIKKMNEHNNNRKEKSGTKFVAKSNKE